MTGTSAAAEPAAGTSTGTSNGTATAAPRPRHDLDEQQRRWQDWVESTSTLLGIDPALVDIAQIHELTKVIAHELDRPLAPVSSFMLGLAIGTRGADADPAALKDTIAATVHRHPHEHLA